MVMPTIDNEIYNRYGRLWWDDDACGAMASIRFLVNPLRFAFFRGVAERLLGSRLRGSCFLDVGCGGGFLAEEFRRLDLRVWGLDVSYNSTLAAQMHAARDPHKVPITYVQGFAERLPFKDHSLDLVACCDMLEHVTDRQTVLEEISRVLKPGGIFFYETINRTLVSWIMTIKAMQEWRSTRFVPQRVHRWDLFIKPKELAGLMARNGLANKEIRGLVPGLNMAANYLNLRRLAAGKIGYRELGRRLKFRLSKDTSNVYIGYAVKGTNGQMAKERKGTIPDRS